MLKNRLLILVKGYPRVDEYFICRELLEWQEQKTPFTVLSLVNPQVPFLQEIHKKIKAKIHYRSSRKIVRKIYFIFFIINIFKVYDLYRLACTQGRKHRGYFLWANFISMIFHRDDFDKIYSHFSNAPTEVAFYLSRIWGKPFYVFAHAKDVYQNIENENYLNILKQAEKIFTCHPKTFSLLNQKLEQVSLIPHGIDYKECPFKLFHFNPEKIRFATFGRIVPKKGIPLILKSLKNLSQKGFKFEYHLHGEICDPLVLELLKDPHIESFTLKHGAYQRDILLKNLSKESYIFLGGFQATLDGDEDGIPNAVAEAMALGMPVLTTLSGSMGDFFNKDSKIVLELDPDFRLYAQQLEKIITEGKNLEIMSQKGYEFLKSHFNFHQQFQKLYKEIIY